MLYDDREQKPVNVDSTHELCCVNGSQICSDNYKGINCSMYCQDPSKMICNINYLQFNNPKHCEATAHGLCLPEGKLVCRDGFDGPGCSIQCKKTSNGYCLDSGLKCNDHRFGYDCSVFCLLGFCQIHEKSDPVSNMFL